MYDLEQNMNNKESPYKGERKKKSKARFSYLYK